MRHEKDSPEVWARLQFPAAATTTTLSAKSNATRIGSLAGLPLFGPASVAGCLIICTPTERPFYPADSLASPLDAVVMAAPDAGGGDGGLKAGAGTG